MTSYPRFFVIGGSPARAEVIATSPRPALTSGSCPRPIANGAQEDFIGFLKVRAMFSGNVGRCPKWVRIARRQSARFCAETPWSNGGSGRASLARELLGPRLADSCHRERLRRILV